MTKNTPENVAAIIRLRNEERLSWREIGERVGMGGAYATTLYLSNSGDKQENAPRRLREQDEDDERTRQIVHLRDNEQRTLDEIGQIYGITRERVRQIYRRAGGQNTGRLPRMRRQPTYCMDCGKELGGRGTVRSLRCKACHLIHHVKTHKYWTEETIVAAILKFKERYDRWPTASDFNPAMGDRLNKPEIRKTFSDDGDYPYVNTVRGVFGSWNNALEAAGRPYEDLYKTNTRAFDDPAAMQRTQEFLDAGLTINEISEIEKVSYQGIQQRIRLLEQGHARRSIVTGEIKHYYAAQVVDGKMNTGEVAREIGTSYSVVQAWVSDERFKREHPHEEEAA